MFISLSLIFYYCSAQTTTNTCQNEATVYKFDIRETILSICDSCTIEDLDPYEICQQTYEYDYIWLTQLWTPSVYNFKNITNPEQTYDYREFQNIKEYEFDPQLGTTQQLISFISRLKSICYHIKVLGEFSFYIGQDSTLLQNKTRFLTRPLSVSFNEQNNRYDDRDLVWAVNSQGKTIPYTAVWNYFQLSPLTDMQDIIYNQILRNNQLDGMVFLQPSLGLYSVVSKFYSLEVSYYGDSTMLKDFYQNFGIKYTQTNYFFMGDFDNINSKNLLLTAGLVQIYNKPLRSKVWLRINYTFSQTLHADNLHVDDLTCLFLNNKSAGLWPRNAVVNQPLYYNVSQCITFNFTYAYGDSYSGSLAGLVNVDTLTKYKFQQPYASAKYGLNAIVSNQVLTNFYGQQSNSAAGFTIKDYDKIQIQLETGTLSNLVFRKLDSSFIRFQQTSYSQNSRFGVGLCKYDTKIGIAFPFYFIEKLKSTFIKINGDRHVESLLDSPNFQFAQVFQSINQYEQNTTLNILALNIPIQSIMAVGICDKDLVRFNKHQLNQNLKGGAFLYQSNGYLINSNIQSYNNQNQVQEYYQGDIISIIFMQSNYSIIFKKNDIYVSTMSIGQFVKNLNFCVGFQQQFQSASLEY